MLTKPKAGVLIRGTDLVRITNGRMRPAQLRSAFGYLDEILGSVPDHVRTAALPSAPPADRTPEQP